MYGKTVIAPLNIVMYNVLSTNKGPDLYGITSECMLFYTAVLCCAVLSVVLCCAVLCSAVLCCAVLHCVMHFLCFHW
jgi:hypothetical protein